MLRSKLKIAMLILFLLLGASQPATAQVMYAFTSQTNTDRFNTLTKQIRCVVCQNQNLAESSAPLAADMREKIYQLMQSNKSDEEIKTYLVARYGEHILLEPRLSKTTFALWVFPFIGLLAVFIFLYSLLRAPSARR